MNRIPLIEVKDPIAPPSAEGEFTPSWQGTTPTTTLGMMPQEEAERVVNTIIAEGARSYGKGIQSEQTLAGDDVMGSLWPSKNGADGKRLVTLFSGQWADVPLEEFLAFAKDAGYGGVELACWHFDLQRALVDDGYVAWIKQLFAKYDLQLVAISSHLVGQAVLDNVDKRHKGILPPYVWGDGNPYGVNYRAAFELMDTAKAASRLGVKVVNGFTGSSIWHAVYDFPPAGDDFFEAGYQLFADRFNPILDVFALYGIVFALEVHPTEIAFDVETFDRALEAIGNRSEFGMNFDPSHLKWQGMDPTMLIDSFPDRVYHVHFKDALTRDGNYRSRLASHLPFGNRARGFDFVSLGRGNIDFNEVVRALNAVGYNGPLSVEWEDSGMERSQGAREALEFTRKTDFSKSDRRMDQAFAE